MVFSFEIDDYLIVNITIRVSFSGHSVLSAVNVNVPKKMLKLKILNGDFWSLY